jgi:hypothetical protein
VTPERQTALVASVACVVVSGIPPSLGVRRS